MSMASSSPLKRKLLEALQDSLTESPPEPQRTTQAGPQSLSLEEKRPASLRQERGGESPDPAGTALSPAYSAGITVEVTAAHASIRAESARKTDFDDTLALKNRMSGGSMADLSAYKDLSKAPVSFGEEESSLSSIVPDSGFERGGLHAISATQHFVQEVSAHEVDTEFSGNVKTLIRLVNELPEGVTKQTGAQIIRLTMEAMGISMENVLSEAQSAQSEMLDAVRANIKKIEEYKTVIRKLETDIKYYQGKANELSEIIDLFILSNTSGQKVPFPDDLTR